MSDSPQHPAPPAAEPPQHPARVAAEPPRHSDRLPAEAPQHADPAGAGEHRHEDRIGAEKHRMRAEILQRRRLLVDPGADQRLLTALETLLTGRTSVAGYVPLRSEPGGSSLVERVARRVPTLLLPILLPDNDLDWARYQGDLTTGPGLRHPPGPRLGRAAIGTVDLVFVPALAVARSGMRLGRGGGSYDRALARVPAGTPIIALLYPDELVDGVPAQPHDRPVSAVLTADGLTQLSSSAPPSSP